MERTINGKPLKQVLEEFLQYFPKEKVETLYGYPYIAIECFRERLDEVVGPFNYDFEVSESRYAVVDGVTTVVSCIGTLSLKDDNGAVVAKRSAQGGTSVTLGAKNGKAVKPKLDISVANQEAFKACCRLFGIADKQLREKRDQMEKESASFTNKAASGSSQNKDADYLVEINGGFSELRGKKGAFGYKVPIIEVASGTMYQMVLYNDGAVKEIESHNISIKRFKELYVPGTRITVTGYINVRNDGEEQIVMKRPAVTKEAS